jgi:large subunit ribosomal protein L34
VDNKKRERLAFFYFSCMMVSIMSATYQPKVKKRKTTHGFLVRQSSTSGQNIIRNRRRKGRTKLAV